MKSHVLLMTCKSFIPQVTSITSFCLFFGLPLYISAETFSFTESVWDHSSVGGPNNSSGWDTLYHQGKTTLPSGLQVTMTSLVSGTAVRAADNLIGGNIGMTAGFRYASSAEADVNLGSNLVNYQEWRFVFSQPVLIGDWRLADIDASGNPSEWIDAIAAEGWVLTPDSLGTGVGAIYDYGPGTNHLITDASSLNIPFVIRDTANFGLVNLQSDDPAGDVFLNFGNNPSDTVSALSLYFFNEGGEDSNLVHAIVTQAELTVSTIPEPSSLLLALAGATFMLGFRRARNPQHF